MARFSFYPELFEHRARVQEALSEAGFEWLSHYSAVDPLHDRHGIEVCGIHERDDAESITELLRGLYPGWHMGRLWHKDYGREPGWKIAVYRDAPERGGAFDAV